MVKQSKWNNSWTFPGGHIEPGEHIIEAAKREAFEETRLDLKPVKVITHGELINSKDYHSPAHFIFFTVLFTTNGKDIQMDAHEISDYVWIKPEEALHMGNLPEVFKESITAYIRYEEKVT